MSESIRIKTDVGKDSDKYLKISLDQDYDFIEILSLNITQEDAYRKFSSDYGVIVGRVIINSGFGVPNAKVSVFIPLDDIDKTDSVISGLYPYEIITDKNSDGIRYNILPKESETNNDCFTPIGTFPTKREVLDNDVMLGIYCKYYKFTTTTNHAGDFMIFGVPLGTYTVHVDADISDIGEASQRPYDLIRQGAPDKIFESGTKFKSGSNLDKLPQVKSANMGVNVQPFWGDTESYEIGITRLDVDLNYNIVPAAIFVGSIFGDQDKHSINKHCSPRQLLGEVCEQVVGPGTIEMIRKTTDNTIESFDVEGGRLIDNDGTWAYQIPMNLDYVVTDETGNLILSQDPNIGIPTRSSVRFRVSMDETGGEGRLRTRAKYLVPNNPENTNEIDYDFGDNTKDTSFKDLYWNKIYTVSNFITRYQNDDILTLGNPFGTSNMIVNPAGTRNMTGIKNVDACAGDKTPFPFNRINTEVNPIFVIICLILSIIGFLVYIINILFVPLINTVLKAIYYVINHIIIDTANAIIDAIDYIITVPKMTKVSEDYIPCVTVQCPSDSGSYFSPGCDGSSDGWTTAQKNGYQPTYYCGSNPDGCDSTALKDCVAFEMAKALGIFQLDFYNDWINGTLFSYLLKYKKKTNGKEKFCEYDCSSFTSSQGYSGVDGNNDGDPDNPCYTHVLLDTLFDSSTGSDKQNNYRDLSVIDGLIKAYDGELYYASTTHGMEGKLFATDIICLGSVFACDWQGFPFLQPYLIPTTYKIPPDIEERGLDCNKNNVTIETGFVTLDKTQGLLCGIDCIGINVNITQALNIRHLCEFGVNIDELIEDQISCTTLYSPDGVIGSYDIDDSIGKEFRDSFFILNSGTTSANSFEYPSGINTNFNLSNTALYYNFTEGTNNGGNNGQSYVDFRGTTSDNSYNQPNHSYYFYFGLLPGKTSLDKMNQRYFTTCPPITRHDMIIESSVSGDTGNTSSGSISFVFVGGHPVYSYTITGPNNYSVNGTTSNSGNATGLSSGSYVITVIDSVGFSISKQVIVSGPTPLYCSVSVTKYPTSTATNDGVISINSFGGGQSPYNYALYDYTGTLLNSSTSGFKAPVTLNGLGVDSLFGYTVTITDYLGDTCTTSGLTLSAPTALSLSSVITKTTCYDGSDGSIDVSPNGGIPLLTYNTTGPAGFTSSLPSMGYLGIGTYVTTVTDANGNTASNTNIITSVNPQLSINVAASVDLSKQCDSTTYHIPFYITAGLSMGDTVYLEYKLDSSGTWSYTTLTYTNSSTLLYLDIPKSSLSSSIKIRFSNTSTHDCHSNILTYKTSQMVLPTANVSGTLTKSVVSVVRGVTTYKHSIAGSGGLGTLTASDGTTTYSLPYDVINTSSTITITITDSVGCTSPQISD